MSIPYDIFTEVFLDKVEEYKFLKLDEYDRTHTVDGYMKRACAQFNRVCSYNLLSFDDLKRELQTEIPEDDLVEIVDIITEGMLLQWMKPYVYKQENYENFLNTTDYSGYSPAELLNRIVAAYKMCKADFSNMTKEYSYNHGDLSNLYT